MHDIKWYGYRVSVSVANGNATIRTRKGHDLTARFPAISADAARLKVRSAVIDGEAVFLDDKGRSSFAELQADLDQHGSARAVLYAFDLLFLDGEPLWDWLKTKCVAEDIFVIIGYQPGIGAVRTPLGNIKVARFDGARLSYAGAVGTGFSERVAAALRERLDRIAAARRPIPGLKVGGAVWLSPALRARIAYRGMTTAGELWYASFKGLDN